METLDTNLLLAATRGPQVETLGDAFQRMKRQQQAIRAGDQQLTLGDLSTEEGRLKLAQMRRDVELDAQRRQSMIDANKPEGVLQLPGAQAPGQDPATGRPSIMQANADTTLGSAAAAPTVPAPTSDSVATPVPTAPPAPAAAVDQFAAQKRYIAARRAAGDFRGADEAAATLLKQQQESTATTKNIAEAAKATGETNKTEETARNFALYQGTSAIQRLPPDQRAAAWPQVRDYLIQSGHIDAAHVSLAYPGDAFIDNQHALAGTQVDKDNEGKEGREKDLAPAALAKANTEADTMARTSAGSLMGSATNAADYATRYNSLKPILQKFFDKPEQFSPSSVGKARLIAQTGEQQIQAAQASTIAGETVRHNKVQESVENARLALSTKEFSAKFGTPQSRSMFTESVIRDPDSYFSLSPEMKASVGNELVSRGLNVPVQIPGDLKSRAVSAGLTLKAIGEVRRLLADPDLAGSIGPIGGRLGNVEQQIGDTFFNQSDPRAQKEQELRTNLAYLKFQEAKGLFGGRPAQELIKSLSAVTANPTMSPALISGSLAAMESSMKRVGEEARSYATGGVTAAGGGGAAPQTAPPFPAKLTQADVNKTYMNKEGKLVTIQAVSPDGSQFK